MLLSNSTNKKILKRSTITSRIIKRALPAFLPYQTSQSTESHVDELLMELLLLLVILPAVQDQNHTREWLKNCIKGWCSVAAWLLDLRSYLFGDEAAAGEDLAAAPEREAAGDAADGAAPVAQQPVAADPGHDGAAAAAPAAQEAAPPAAAAAAADNIDGLGAAHHALLQREAPQGTQPYVRPTFFPLRVTDS